STLPAEAGERLRALIGEERVRWGEIRRLIGADAGAAAPASAAAPAPAPAQASAPEAERAPAPLHPYSRAYREGMRQLAALGPAPAPAMPSNARTPPGTAGSSFTVGSLKRRR